MSISKIAGERRERGEVYFDAVRNFFAMLGRESDTNHQSRS
jgi:hypothetical protein